MNTIGTSRTAPGRDCPHLEPHRRPHVASVGETKMLETVQSLSLWDHRSADEGDHRRAGG